MKNSEFQFYSKEKTFQANEINPKMGSNINNNLLSNNNLNNTKFLIEDTMGASNNSLFFSNLSHLKNANLQSKLNNTQNLLNDKNSIFSHGKLISSNLSDNNKFREKYKDLLPEINIKNSMNINKDKENNYNSESNPNIDSNLIQNKSNEIPFKYDPENKNMNKNYANEICIIENIKEENDIDTINLTENNRDNQLTTNFNISKEDSDITDDKRNTNLYCLTNSNLENRFYSSILETNEFLKNQKAEKDENSIDSIDNKMPNDFNNKDNELLSLQKIEENFELEKIKNQKYLNDLRNQNEFKSNFNNNNYYDDKNKYYFNLRNKNQNVPSKNNNMRIENINPKTLSFRQDNLNNNYEINKDNRLQKNNIVIKETLPINVSPIANLHNSIYIKIN